VFDQGSTFHFEIPVEFGASRSALADGSAAPLRNGTDFLTSNTGMMFTRPPGENPTNPELEIKDPEEGIPRILVVEDNVLNQKVAVNFLRRLNIPSDVAGNGEIAVNLYKDHPTRYGAILMDICMPVKDGLDASREIRAFELISAGRSPRLALMRTDTYAGDPLLNPRQVLTSSGTYRRVPIVALSAQVMDQDRDACMMAGMDGFLEKPVRFENLRKLLTPIYSPIPKWQNPFP